MLKGIKKNPILLIYLIDKDSKPQKGEKTIRSGLGTKDNIVAYAIGLPLATLTSEEKKNFNVESWYNHNMKLEEGEIRMSLTTNIIDILADAQRGREQGSRRIMNLLEGIIIPGLYVRYEEGYDYLVFDKSNEIPFDEWKEEYNAVGYLVGENPKTGENALHIK